MSWLLFTDFPFVNSMGSDLCPTLEKRYAQSKRIAGRHTQDSSMFVGFCAISSVPIGEPSRSAFEAAAWLTAARPPCEAPYALDCKGSWL